MPYLSSFMAQNAVQPTPDERFSMFHLPIEMDVMTPNVLPVARAAQGTNAGAKYGSEATMNVHVPTPISGAATAAFLRFCFRVQKFEGSMVFRQPSTQFPKFWSLFDGLSPKGP